MHTRKLALTVAMSSLAAVAPISAVSADGPVTVTSHFEGTDVLADCGAAQLFVPRRLTNWTTAESAKRF